MKGEGARMKAKGKDKLLFVHFSMLTKQTFLHISCLGLLSEFICSWE